MSDGAECRMDLAVDEVDTLPQLNAPGGKPKAKQRDHIFHRHHKILQCQFFTAESVALQLPALSHSLQLLISQCFFHTAAIWFKPASWFKMAIVSVDVLVFWEAPN